MLFKRIPLAFIGLFPMADIASAENSIHLDVTAGQANVSNLNYDRGFALDHSAALSSSGFAVRGGYLLIDNIESSLGRDEANADLKVRGPYLSVSKTIPFDTLTVEFGGGLLYSTVTAQFSGRDIESSAEARPMFNIKLLLPLQDYFALQGDWKYIDDLEGADMHLIQAGVRFSF